MSADAKPTLAQCNGMEPAFHHPAFTTPNGDTHWGYGGLTKREYMATAILQNVAVADFVIGGAAVSIGARITFAVEVADMLLAELARVQP
jgi:hypothetical protein